MIHELKCWPSHFEALVDGRKKAELRLNDRNYREGDLLWQREWDIDQYRAALNDGSTHEEATDFAYTGQEAMCQVTHLLNGGPWLVKGYVMMSVVLINTGAAARLIPQELMEYAQEGR